VIHRNTPGPKVLKHQSYRAMPWRNGRGTTLEIAREPASGEGFAWRLSLADIAEDGKFSAYPGYSRALVLVDGLDLRLRYRGHGHSFLTPTRRATRFEGEWQTGCAIPQGRCTDLSLIVRKGAAAHPAAIVRAPKVLPVRSTRRVALPASLYAAVFILEGTLAAADAARRRLLTLRSRDTLLFRPGRARTLLLRNRGRSTARLVILCWRPGTGPETTATITTGR
jgi:environmental stress-induced protein Ves